MKTGVIGLGVMGAGMAKNFAKANHLETVYNRTLSKAESIAKECDCTISMTLIHYQRLIDEGYGDEDISALFRLKEKTLK